MGRFATAAIVGQLIAFLGWLLVLAGVVLLFIVLNNERGGFFGWPMTLPVAVMLSGLLTVCQGQLVQAVVAVAGNTAETTKLLKAALDQLQSLKVQGSPSSPNSSPRLATSSEAHMSSQAYTRPSSAEDIDAARKRLNPEAASNFYRGHFIASLYADGKYSYVTNGRRVATLDEAVQAIDAIVESDGA